MLQSYFSRRNIKRAQINSFNHLKKINIMKKIVKFETVITKDEFDGSLIYTPTVLFEDGNTVTYTEDDLARFGGQEPSIIGLNLDEFILVVRPSIKFKDHNNRKRNCYGVFINGVPTELHDIPFVKHIPVFSDTYKDPRDLPSKYIFVTGRFMHGYWQYCFYTELSPNDSV